MASDPVTSPARRWSPRSLSRSWVLVLAGLALVVIGILAGLAAPPAKAMLLIAGLIVAGFGVSRRLHDASTDFEARVESAGLIALAAFVALTACLGTDKDWSSTRLLLGVLVGVALAGAGVVLLPPRPQRIVISLLILFHFAGILTATASVPTPGGMIPWLPTQLQVRVFHHYLEFNYLINAYHFYSPDPGPPNLLWFRVRYNDGTARWIKTPVREDHNMGLNYQRMLALTENVSSPGPSLTRAQIEKRYQLTDRSVEAARKAGVPEDVLLRLRSSIQVAKPSLDDLRMRGVSPTIVKRLGSFQPQAQALALLREAHVPPADADRLIYFNLIDMIFVAPEEPGEEWESDIVERRSLLARARFLDALRTVLDDKEFSQWHEALVRAAELPTWESITTLKYPHDPFEDVLKRRCSAAIGPTPIPFANINNSPIPQQYAPPTGQSLLVLASYARHVAVSSPHPTNPSAKVKSIKIYRITHNLIEPAQFALGIDPRHPAFLMSFYLGEYSPEGKLLDPKDRLLYWLLPIGYVFQPVQPGLKAWEQQSQVQVGNPVKPSSAQWINCLKQHAGDFQNWEQDVEPETKPAESSRP